MQNLPPAQFKMLDYMNVFFLSIDPPALKDSKKFRGIPDNKADKFPDIVQFIVLMEADGWN